MENVFTVRSCDDWQLPHKSNLINFSLLKEIHSKAPFRSFSVKYVCHGNEMYTVNGNKYTIETGQYLLANHYAEGFVEIDKPVKGICIDVAPDLLSEVVANYLRPDSPYSDLELDTFFNTTDFLENKYQAAETHVGHFLHQLDAELTSDPGNIKSFTREFYFTLAEKIVADHIPVYKQFQSIPSVKAATKKDLLRRMMKARSYIDSHFNQPLDIKSIAMESCISEYHFYRLFKTVFAISPHQYLIRKRLTHAASRIKEGGMGITEIALASGFSDIYTFSKSFRKYFGVTPSKFF